MAKERSLDLFDLIMRIPVVGTVIRDAFRPGGSGIYYFVFNLATILALAVWLFGPAALIVYGLIMTLVLFVVILIICTTPV